MHSVENELVWVVRGHSRSLIMAPFDRVHAIPISLSYQQCACLALFLRYSEILVENRRLDLPHLY